MSLSFTLSNHTAPLGKPTAEVGIFFIERLFTKVVQDLSVVIHSPTIWDEAKVALLFLPPNIPEYAPDAELNAPPPTVDAKLPDAVF